MLTLSNQSSEHLVSKGFRADNLKETMGISRLPLDTKGYHRATLGSHRETLGYYRILRVPLFRYQKFVSTYPLSAHPLSPVVPLVNPRYREVTAGIPWDIAGIPRGFLERVYYGITRGDSK